MITEEEAIELLRHYRHDWMNQVQLLLGYASMGKMDKVQEKLKENVALMDQERKITNLRIPKTALWVINFNTQYENFRLTYRVEEESVDLSDHDDRLHNQLQQAMNVFHSFGDPYELYHGQLFIKGNNQTNALIELAFSGAFRQINNIEQQLLAIDGLEVTFSSIAEDQCTIRWVCK